MSGERTYKFAEQKYKSVEPEQLKETSATDICESREYWQSDW